MESSTTTNTRKRVKCEHCGANTLKYRYHLNERMVSILMRFWEASGHRVMPLKLLDVPLTKVQYANFNRLRYWDLVQPSTDLFGKRMEGRWHVTQLGAGFLEHGVLVPEFVHTYRGTRTGFEGREIGMLDCVPNGWPNRSSTLRNSEGVVANCGSEELNVIR
jgi:hypothetical protein